MLVLYRKVVGGEIFPGWAEKRFIREFRGVVDSSGGKPREWREKPEQRADIRRKKVAYGSSELGHQRLNRKERSAAGSTVTDEVAPRSYSRNSRMNPKKKEAQRPPCRGFRSKMQLSGDA